MKSHRFKDISEIRVYIPRITPMFEGNLKYLAESMLKKTPESDLLFNGMCIWRENCYTCTETCFDYSIDFDSAWTKLYRALSEKNFISFVELLDIGLEI